MDWNVLVSANSGPVWGLLGVLTTALLGYLKDRRKTDTDASAATLTAINAGHKQLVDALFQQVKVLTEQVKVLTDDVNLQRGHTEECERQHRETLARLNKLERASGSSD